MTINTLENLGTLINIPEKYLVGMKDKLIYVVADGVNDALKSEESIAEFDVGVGKLIIGVVGNEIKYKFIPTKELDNAIKNTIKTGKSPLTPKLESAITSKITNIYKELF